MPAANYDELKAAISARFPSMSRQLQAIARFALERPNDLALGTVALIVLVMGWDTLSRATGREVEPGFMGDVLKSARDDGALWLLTDNSAGRILRVTPAAK